MTELQKPDTDRATSRDFPEVGAESFQSTQDALPPTVVEHGVALVIGGLLLVIGVSLWAWGIRLSLAGFTGEAGWPPGLVKLLFPVLLTAAFVGFGSWRMLLVSLPQGGLGLPLGKWVLGLFGLSTVLGLVM